VSEAAATMFADAVNAGLPERTEETGEAVDGSALVTVSTRAESDDEWRTRRFKRWGWTLGLPTVAGAVTIGILGPVVAAVIYVLVTPFGLRVAGFGAMLLRLTYDIWYLPRHGITVEARRSGVSYVYTDSPGVTHSEIDLFGRSTAPTVHVAYHPETNASVFVYSWLRKVWLTSF
jgi:hypothetical protein